MNSSLFKETLEYTFEWFSHNSSYAIPGLYDVSQQDFTWVILSALTFFTMQTGFALIEAGIVRPENAVNVMIKNFIDVCFGGTAYWLCGYGLMYGRGRLTNPFFGAGDFLVDPSPNDPLMGQIFAFFLFEVSFMSTIVSAASGAVSERIRLVSYAAFSTSLVLTYSICGGWLWGEHGFLKNLGALDFAGAAPMHIPGGVAAFYGAWFLGPRIGRFDKGTQPLPLHQPVYSLIGLFLLWWGWIGFNAGSSYGVTDGKWNLALKAGVGTTLASMSAGVVSVIYSMIRNKGKIDVFMSISGVVTSLVAINAGCFLFPAWASVAVGVIAAVLCLTVGPIIDKMRIDDPCGAISVHFFGGLWGHIAVGLFADPPEGRKGLFINGDWYQLAVQCFSSVCITIFSAVVSIIILWLIDEIFTLRMTPDEEIAGSEIVYHYIQYEKEVDIPLGTIEKVINMTEVSDTYRSPTPQNTPSFGLRKVVKGHSNKAFDSRDVY